MTRNFIFLLLLAAGAAAQEKVTVPLSNPSQPATVKARLITGSITVTPGAGRDVVVDTGAPGVIPGRAGGNPPPGMHRIYAGRGGFNVDQDNNVVTIHAGPGAIGMNLTLQVPLNTSVELKTLSGGHIDVTGLSGDIDVENINGAINLQNVSGAISAHTLNGAITATLDRPAADKPMSFSSLNGRIDVTLPAATKANLRLKTTYGSVFSDFDVKMEPAASKPVIESGQGQGGKYRIRVDRGVSGTINGGGPEYSFQTMNGAILIHKK